MAIDYTPLPILPVVESRLIGNVILVFLTVLVVVLRFVARLVTGSKLGWDDFLTLSCLPQGIGLLLCQGLFSTAGLGYSADVAQVNITYISIVTIPIEILYATCIVTAKLSVLFFYLRVFSTKAMRRATICMMVLTAVWGAANLLQSLFVCRFQHGKLNFLDKSQCEDQVPSFVASGLFNCTTNLIINLLPLYTIWSLRVTVSTRMGLTVIFVLSLNVTWASIVRIALLTRTVNSNEVFKAVDLITFLTVLEVNLSILCNSLPMLLPLYSYWRYRKFFAEGEDEYVSRVRGGSEKRNERRHLVQSVANGLPLETIYGKDNVHFTATVIRGASLSQGRTEREQSVGRSASTPEDDGGHWNEDSESTRRLSRNAGAITIETKWTITESRKSAFDMD